MRNSLLVLRGVVLLMFSTLFFNSSLFATHITGVDMTYECLSNNQYVITVSIYRDCDPFASTFTSANISATSASCNISSGLNWNLPAIDTVEVSQLCPSDLPNSTCNGGTLPGREVRIYRDTITLPQTCDDWIVSWSTCCRNNSITNISNPGGAGMYAEVFINSNYCSNSPVFSSLPNPYFCAGQLYNYNHGAFDSDGDSLYYEMITPYDNANTFVTFVAGHNVNSPLRVDPGTTFQFSQFTGQMTFQPLSNTQQIGVTAVRVYEVRNGDTIGYVMRDIQMVVLNDPNCTGPISSNTPAVLTGGSYDTTTQAFVVCAGEQLVFDIELSDPDGDTIVLDTNNTNLLSVFGQGNFNTVFVPINGRLDSVRLTVLINAVPNNLGNNYFTIGVTDNACPVPGSQILGYNVIIPGVEVEASDTTLCPGIAHNIQLDARSFTSTGTSIQGGYNWNFVKTYPGVAFSDDTIKSPSLFIPPGVPSNDTIILEVTYTTQPDPNSGTQCVTTDEVMIFLDIFPIDVDVLASDTSLCPNNLNDIVNFNTNVSATSGSVDVNAGTYSWTANPASYLSGLNNTNTPDPTASISGSFNDSLTYTVTYDYGLCTGSDSIQLKFDYGQISVAGDTSVCPGDTVQLSAVWGNGGPPSIGGCGINPATCPNPLTSTVGNGSVSTTSSTPFFGLYEDRRVQYLYRAADLTASGVLPGIISEIAWDVTSINSSDPYNNFTIKMGCTSLNDLAGQTTFVPGLATVYTGTSPYIPTVGWNNFVLDNSYEWDGSSNIIIEICFNNPDWTSSDPVNTTTTPYQSVFLAYADNVNTTCAPASSFFINTTNADLPNIQLSNCGAPDVSYQWGPPIGFIAAGGDTTDSPFIGPQANTTYTVSLTEGGCTLWDSVDVQIASVIPPPTISCGTPTNQATSVLFEWGGSVGAGGWEYSLDSGVTWIPKPYADSSQLVTGLANGDCFTILVRATGGAGPCLNNAATAFTCCTTPCPPPTSYIDTVDVSCFNGSDGSLTLFVDGANGALGANPPYTVTLFDTSGSQVQTPVSTGVNANFTGLPAGSYYMTVQDTLGCFGLSDTVVLDEPAELIGSITGTAMTACYNTTDGSATVAATGGTPFSTGGYTYSWDANALSQTSATADSLMQGSYSVVVTDSLGCTDTVDNINVTAPFVQAPTVVVDTTPSTTCSGNGSATITLVQNFQGNPTPDPNDPNALSYVWSNGLTDTLSASGLAPGTYSIEVTDTMGCADTVSFTITGGAVTVIDNILSYNPGCGQNNGAATAQPSGATSYTYLWSDGQTTASASGLGVGMYYVTVTGDNGCEAVDSVDLINQNGPTISSTTFTNPGCTGGTAQASITAANGTAPYTYLWSDGQTTQTATGLTSGPIGVTVTDFNSCVVDTTINISTPQITSTATGTNATCGQTNGTATVTPAGAPSYSYLWSDGQTSQTAAGLTGGTYYVTITGSNGCVTTDSATIETAALAISVDDRDERVCYGQATGYIDIGATFSGTAGVTPSYAWSGPNGFTATTEDIDSLAAGVYTVTATLQTGAQACVGTISVEIFDKDSLEVSIEEVTPLDCSNQNAVVAARASGGWPDYTYTWDDNSTISDRGPVGPGTYTVTVMDTEGCMDTASYTVAPLLIPTLDAWIESQGQTQASMLQNDAPLDIDAGANEAGVQYQWLPTTNIADPTAPATTVSGPDAGTFEYTIVATAGSCSTSDTVVLVVDPTSFLGMPNAFTPDGDGQNDLFRPVQAVGIEVMEFKVFNRWGQVLYDNPGDYANGWDGTLNGQEQPRDVYLYLFEYKLPGDSETTVIRGEVTLLR